MERTYKCRICKKDIILTASEEEWTKYDANKLNIQDCFSVMSVDDRELLVSGICGVCYDKMFDDVEEY